MRDKFLTDNFGLSTRAINCCRNASILTLGDLIDTAKKGELSQIKNCGTRTVRELKTLVNRYTDISEDAAYNLFANIQNETVEPGTLEEAVIVRLAVLDRTSEANANFKQMDSVHKWLVEQEFARITATISRRAQNAISKMRLGVPEVLYIVSGSNPRRYIASNCGVYTIQEIKEKFAELADYILYVQGLTAAEATRKETAAQFTFLSEAEVAHVSAYKMRRKHLPACYIIWKYFSSTTDRDARIYARHHGFKEAPNSFYNMATESDLSAERMRQIARGFRLPEAVEAPIIANMHDYAWLSARFIRSADVHRKIIKDEFPENILPEEVSPRSILAIVSILAKGMLVVFDSTPYCLSSATAAAFDYKKAWRNIKAIVNSKRYDSMELCIDDLTLPYLIDSTDDNTAIAKALMTGIAADCFGMETDAEGRIFLRQNMMNIEGEVYKMIAQRGEPMTLAEIAEEMQRRFPERELSSIESLRNNIIQSKRLSAIGKTSTYALKEWNVNSQTIREMIESVLRESELPLKSRQITDILSQKGKPQNINNVHATIYSDTKHGFVRFEGNYFGLADKTYPERYVQVPMRNRKLPR